MLFELKLIEIQIQMLVDISQPKSRGFNIFLRFFQLGLQLIIGLKLSSLGSDDCRTSFTRLAEPISYILIALNLLAIIYLRCREKFPRIQFFIFFAIDLILTSVVVVMGFASSNQSNQCAANKVITRFSFIQGVITIILSFMILFMSFGWIQRYSNTPGNLVWPCLFFGFAYEKSYSPIMILIGLICLLISMISFSVHFVAACKGTTTKLKKIIIVCWIIGCVLMIVCQVLAIVQYLSNGSSSSYFDIIARKILIIFVPINILDLLFWLWGLLTLTYQNGDLIRDTLLNFNQDNEINNGAEDNFNEIMSNNIGTVK